MSEIQGARKMLKRVRSMENLPKIGSLNEIVFFQVLNIFALILFN